MNRQKQKKRLYLMKFLGFIDLEIVDKGCTWHIRPLSPAGTSLKENKAQVSFQRLTSKIQLLARVSQGATLCKTNLQPHGESPPWRNDQDNPLIERQLLYLFN